jgi:hypothetical protein
LVALVAAWTIGGQVSAAAASSRSSCPQSVHVWLNRTRMLDSHLSKGMSFAAFKSQAQAVYAAYDRVPVLTSLSDGCQQVAIPLDMALTQYAGGWSYWRTCISRGTCNHPAVKRTLQRIWSTAHRDLQLAIRNLAL